MTAWTLRMPRFVSFGAGALSDLEEHLSVLGRSEILLVTDPGVVAAGLVDGVEKVASGTGFAPVVFDALEPQPDIETIQRAVDTVRQRPYAAIVAVGGGSVVDPAKIMALLATNDGSVRDVIEWFGQGFGRERSLAGPLPLFTVPTNISGADFVPAAVVTDRAAGTKFANWSLGMMPAGTFVDPANTATLPRDVLVDAGLDSFSHALEGLTSRKGSPLARHLAIDAAARIHRALPVVDSSPDDAAAREELCLGCVESAIVIANTRAAAIHGLSYPVSATFPISHGRSNSLLAPAVVRFNSVAVSKEYTALAAALDLPPTDEPGEALADAISQMNHQLGLPAGLSELGMGVDHIPDLVARAERNRWFFDEVNPRPASSEDLARLYREALGGSS